VPPPPPAASIFELTLDTAADNYAVFGCPVAHSRSPAIHRLFARQTRQPLHYQAVLVPPGQFAEALDRFRVLGGKGLNITLPFKGDAWHAATVRSPRAERCGSVNTMWFDADGGVHGDTTDGIGLLRDLDRLGMEIPGRPVLVLGAGGAAGAVLPDIVDRAPAHVTVANRTIARAVELVQRLAGGRDDVEACGYAALAGRRYQLIINCTSAGLAGAVPPLPNGILADRAACYDLVYGDGPTPFCRWARDRGARRVSDGLGMLVEQAAESFFLWRGVRPATLPVLATLRTSARSGR
jgi:shikimate dehydrogenase